MSRVFLLHSPVLLLWEGPRASSPSSFPLETIHRPLSPPSERPPWVQERNDLVDLVGKAEGGLGFPEHIREVALTGALASPGSPPLLPVPTPG